MKLQLTVGSAALLAILPVMAIAGEGTTDTHVTNGGNSATVVQSGNPDAAQVRIVQHPGYTRIEQHSRNNSATVIQMGGSGGSH